MVIIAGTVNSSVCNPPSISLVTFTDESSITTSDALVATNASEVVIEDSSVKVTREIDGGLQTLELTVPAIITTDLRLNEPRYASLPNIMKAKKKELNVVSASEMGIDINSRTELLSVELPPSREAGIIVETVDQLVDKLKNEAKVIQ